MKTFAALSLVAVASAQYQFSDYIPGYQNPYYQAPTAKGDPYKQANTPGNKCLYNSFES